MNLSQRCQYTVRAVLELAKRHGQGPVSAAEIAAHQAIPQRFLEIILNELKPSGLVESRRGVQGGYYLIRSPAQITVGQVIRLVDGPLDPVRCEGEKPNTSCQLMGKCALIDLWNQARQAVETVYDSTTFQNLVEREQALRVQGTSDYCI